MIHNVGAIIPDCGCRIVGEFQISIQGSFLVVGKDSISNTFCKCGKRQRKMSIFRYLVSNVSQAVLIDHYTEVAILGREEWRIDLWQGDICLRENMCRDNRY